MNEVTTILEFLGEENQKKIKDRMTDAIIDNLEESINDEWFVCPSTIHDLMEELFMQIFKKHKKELNQAMEAKFREFINKAQEGETK